MTSGRLRRACRRAACRRLARGSSRSGSPHCPDARILRFEPAHHESEFRAELLRDLPPAHPVSTHLQDPLVLHGFAVHSDRTAIKGGHQLFRRRLHDALLRELVPGQRERR